MKELKGIYPAIVTAFDDSGSFDAAAMRRIVRYQLAAGAHGFYVCGGTGEGLLLTVQERQEVIETVVDEVAGKAGVIAHVGAFRTAETMELARHACTVGVDAVAALPPSYFYTPDTMGLVRHYTELAEASSVPLLIYNLPQRTGITMTRELFDELMQVDNIVGMKDSSGNIMGLGKFMADHPDAVIFNGEDTVLIAGLLAGACGGIGASYNLMPHLFVQLWNAVQAGDMVRLAATQSRLHEIWNAAGVVELFAGIKQAMAWMGLPCGVPRSPLRPLTEEETRRLRQSLEQIDFLAETENVGL
jgi:N-acetylneuraminate lyase